MSKQTSSAPGTVSDILITSAGNPIADNQNSLTTGPRSPLLLPEVIQYRQIGLFAKCDPAYGAGVANALNLCTAGRNRAHDIGAADKSEEASLRAPSATRRANLSL